LSDPRGSDSVSPGPQGEISASSVPWGSDLLSDKNSGPREGPEPLQPLRHGGARPGARLGRILIQLAVASGRVQDVLSGVRLHAVVVEAVRVPPWGHCFCSVANPTPREWARRKSRPGGQARRNPTLRGRTRRSPPRGTGCVEAHALGSSESEPMPWGQTRQKPHPQSWMRRGPAPRVGRGRNFILGVGRGPARPVGSDEVETSSSELDDAPPGPWGVGQGRSCILNHRMRRCDAH